MDVIIVIDKEKLSQELKDKLPEDMQGALLELMQQNSDRDDQQKQAGTFEVQCGTVIGNIYTDKDMKGD